ncbi:MAG: helix-turn-helix domain-containing protein [Alphaproteobacteria bacterium]
MTNTEQRPNRIKEWRNRRRMSLAELGEIIGLSRSEISKLENGARRIRSDHLITLSKALRVRAEDLLSPEDADGLVSYDAGDGDSSSKRPGLDLPVCGTMTEIGFQIDEASPQVLAQRPPQLTQVTGAYAVNMPTGNLDPHVKVGTLLYVNPVLPPRAEDLAVVRYNTDKKADVVFVTRDTSGSLVGKTYGDSGASTIIDLAANDVKAVHRVVGSWYS